MPTSISASLQYSEASSRALGIKQLGRQEGVFDNILEAGKVNLQGA